MKGIRNIAIIAHVDHGKTTLVDKILHHCKLFRDNQETGDLILDNNDIERERGITILSKNVSLCKQLLMRLDTYRKSWPQNSYPRLEYSSSYFT